MKRGLNHALPNITSKKHKTEKLIYYLTHASQGMHQKQFIPVATKQAQLPVVMCTDTFLAYATQKVVSLNTLENIAYPRKQAQVKKTGSNWLGVCMCVQGSQ